MTQLLIPSKVAVMYSTSNECKLILWLSVSKAANNITMWVYEKNDIKIASHIFGLQTVVQNTRFAIDHKTWLPVVKAYIDVDDST